MRRPLLVLLLLVVAGTTVLLASSPPDPAASSPGQPPRPAPTRPTPRPAAEEVAWPPLPPAGELPEAAPAGQADPAEAEGAPAPPADGPGGWEGARLLPQGWPALVAAIAAAVPPSLPCRDHLPLGRYRTRPAGDPQAAVLLLQVEPGRGEVLVVDAPAERPGRTDPATLSCVQGALRGLKVALPDARPGPRVRLRYPLR